jgi:phosphopentomutase
MKRALVIVLDSVGIGEAHDAADYGDVGSNTLLHIAEKFEEEGIEFSLPNLHSWGLTNICPIPQHKVKNEENKAFYGTLVPKSKGKDTTVGHWEMVGIVLDEPFPTYPNGFPPEIVNRLEKETGYKFIGNKTASGTVIIEELGKEHMESKALILYTSADSVVQIAAHEKIVPIEELYRICDITRKISDEYNIGRVIARPFDGEPGSFKRTVRRHDYSMEPPYNVLNLLDENNIKTTGVGKIFDIFNGSGVSTSHKTEGNAHGIQKTIELWKDFKEGVLFVNLVDFDMLYGHRNNWRGYGDSLMEFDKALPEIEKISKEGDLVFITADHGNDPTFPGTDHNRENVLCLVYRPEQKGLNLGERKSFADLGATLTHYFGVKWEGEGVPFFE